MSGLTAPTGTHDVLAPESARWQHLVAAFAGLARQCGYGLLLTPVFEDVAVFRRGVGAVSEVVTKEMYEFEDKGGRHLALRPEGTAPVVRAYLEHRPPVPFKAWYVTPAFRYERAQAGRYRQHHQFGVEVLGSEDPDLDVEVIGLLATFYEKLGLRRVALRVNSLGDGTCRPAYREALVSYLDAHAGELCDEHREHYRANPLRVLDCKRAPCLAVRAGAPRLVEMLCEDCAAHYARVREGLHAAGLSFSEDPFLVRGLDYYTRTTFEFSGEALQIAQNALGGGGRYDGLAEALGGPPTAGVGFGTGIERILLACDAEGVAPAPEVSLSVFVIDLVDGRTARDLTRVLRGAGIAADRGFDQRSLRAQLRQADRLGAPLAAIVGTDEAAAGAVTLKDLRSGADRQEQIAQDALVETVREWLR